MSPLAILSLNTIGHTYLTLNGNTYYLLHWYIHIAMQFSVLLLGYKLVQHITVLNVGSYEAEVRFCVS